jgi:AcrR family transcriptional regulator
MTRPGSTLPRRSTQDTRLAILRAAERLFATRGVDAVSLREVSAEAGQHNNSAVSYHFASREGLIDAILERHSTPIQARFGAQLELLERQHAVTLRALIEILVRSIVAKLDDPDGGWEYISLAAQLSVSPHFPLANRPVARTPEVLRLTMKMAPFVQTPPQLMILRFDRLANTLYASLVAWHRLVRDGLVTVSRDAFEDDLIDTLTDLIERPATAATLTAIARGGEPTKPPLGSVEENGPALVAARVHAARELRQKAEPSPRE